MDNSNYGLGNEHRLASFCPFTSNCMTTAFLESVAEKEWSYR